MQSSFTNMLVLDSEVSDLGLNSRVSLKEHPGRMARDTWSDTSTKIDELSLVLLELKDAFDRGIALHSTFVSVKLLDTVQKLGQLKTFRLILFPSESLLT